MGGDSFASSLCSLPSRLILTPQRERARDRERERDGWERKCAVLTPWYPQSVRYHFSPASLERMHCVVQITPRPP